jgi:hypothetical protein
MYDALSILREGLAGSHYVFSSQFVVDFDGHFDGFAMYLAYGNDLSHLQTSNKDDSLPPATGWMNVFLPCPQRYAVRAGDVIVCVVTCHVACPEPSYHYRVTVRSGGKRWEFVSEVSYRDIICRVLPISKALQNMKVLANAMQMPL